MLTAGPTPQTAVADWSLALQHGGKLLGKWSWDAFNALPQTEVTVDIHCVTKWSKLDTHWQGVSIETLFKDLAIDPKAMYVTAFSDGGYTTNLPLADMVGREGIHRLHLRRQAASPEHGGPARLLVPQLYFWKSAKWVRGLRLMEADRPGFGNRSATTTTAIRGKRSATRAIHD